jgi:hypothetical protein
MDSCAITAAPDVLVVAMVIAILPGQSPYQEKVLQKSYQSST